MTLGYGAATVGDHVDQTSPLHPYPLCQSVEVIERLETRSRSCYRVIRQTVRRGSTVCGVTARSKIILFYFCAICDESRKQSAATMIDKPSNQLLSQPYRDLRDRGLIGSLRALQHAAGRAASLTHGPVYRISTTSQHEVAT
jgi:hypothetical protein